MGFNPFRPNKTSPADLAMVIGAIVATILLVAWAIFGG